MNTEIKGGHFEITDKIRQYVDKKLQRLKFAEEHLVDLLLHITHEKSLYKLETNLNFRWGHSIHVGEQSFDIFEGIDKLFDKMERKVAKEKKKIQEHKGPGHDREA